MFWTAEESSFEFRHRHHVLLCTDHPDRLWFSPSLVFSTHRGRFCGSKLVATRDSLTNHRHLELGEARGELQACMVRTGTSFWRQVHSLFQCDFCTERDIVLLFQDPVYSVPLSHPVAAFAFILVFLSLLSSLE
jgi:hypothetical protein